MTRFLLSLLLGLGLGVAAGLFIGWEVAPTEYVDSPLPALAPRFKDEYTVMVAAGFAADNDTLGAVERLRLLNVANVAQYVQETTERFITNSRDLTQIRLLVNLSEGLGRLTPIMETFRGLSPIGGSTSP
jgi:hypothetical protein